MFTYSEPRLREKKFVREIFDKYVEILGLRKPKLIIELVGASSYTNENKNGIISIALNDIDIQHECYPIAGLDLSRFEDSAVFLIGHELGHAVQWQRHEDWATRFSNQYWELYHSGLWGLYQPYLELKMERNANQIAKLIYNSYLKKGDINENFSLCTVIH